MPIRCTSPTGYQFEALSHHACLAKLQRDDGLRPACAPSRRELARAAASIAASASRRSSRSPIPVRRSTASAARGFRRRTARSSSITPSGDVRCLISVTELGQGTETIIGQIVAEHLGVDRRSHQGHHRRYRNDAAWRRDLGLPRRRHRRRDRVAGRAEAEGKCVWRSRRSSCRSSRRALDIQNG